MPIDSTQSEASERLGAAAAELRAAVAPLPSHGNAVVLDPRRVDRVNAPGRQNFSGAQ
jgi:hypothetical protein